MTQKERTLQKINGLILECYKDLSRNHVSTVCSQSRLVSYVATAIIVMQMISRCIQIAILPKDTWLDVSVKLVDDLADISTCDVQPPINPSQSGPTSQVVCYTFFDGHSRHLNIKQTGNTSKLVYFVFTIKCFKHKIFATSPTH